MGKTWESDAPLSYVIFLLLCAIWGSSFILMKKASLAFGPITIAGIRCGLAVLTILCFWRVLRRGPRPSWAALPKLVVISALGYAIPYAVQPYLVARYGSGFIGMMVCFVPLLTILFAIPVNRTYASRWQWVGVLGGLVCMAVVFADGLQRHVPVPKLAIALVVPACYALANTLVTRWFPDAAPLVLTALGTGLAALALLPLGASLETVHLGTHLTLALSSVLVLGTLGTGLAVYLFYRLILGEGPLFAGMVTYVIPWGALLWGWADAERITTLQVVALVGVALMVAVVQRDIVRSRADQSSSEAR